MEPIRSTFLVTASLDFMVHPDIPRTLKPTTFEPAALSRFNSEFPRSSAVVLVVLDIVGRLRRSGIGADPSGSSARLLFNVAFDAILLVVVFVEEVSLLARLSHAAFLGRAVRLAGWQKLVAAGRKASRSDRKKKKKSQ